MRRLRLLRNQLRDEQEKDNSISIPLDEKMKKQVWEEYLKSLMYIRYLFPDDFKDVPLEPTMPDDIEEVFRLRNSLYKYMNPIYVNSYW